MPCKMSHDDEGRVTAIVCSRGARPKACFDCGRPSVALCDWPLVGPKDGKTCDKPMCSGCRNHHAELGDIDYCRVHEKMHAERTEVL
jgi:hypothetical protein